MPDSDCLFCQMASGAMDVPKLHDDDRVFAIRDINPRAPVHLLVIPKEHIPTALDLNKSHGDTLARLYEVAGELARDQGFAQDGFRLAVNCGDDGGQTIYHLHMHVLAGRKLGPEG
ncbi:MAG TPA: histidine triad nucleotide-binding protein [Dehalococcoidia bacterium]|nr:histidine triad nucleotide-binding protein [Dehalococcoidia bacterium]